MSRRSIQVKAILSLGIVVGLGAVSTLAAWSGTATATSNITAAQVSLGVGAAAASATTPSYTVPVSSVRWYPGVSAAAVVVVKNTSTVPMPFSIKGTITESGGAELGKAMNVVVKTGATLSGTAPNVTCAGGTTLVTKAAGAAFGAEVTRPTLVADASESLCVQYSLPAAAANNLQGTTTKLDLIFTATVGS